MTEDEQRIVVPGLRICAAEEDHISGKFDTDAPRSKRTTNIS